MESDKSFLSKVLVPPKNAHLKETIAGGPKVHQEPTNGFFGIFIKHLLINCLQLYRVSQLRFSSLITLLFSSGFL
jgi:hypothetical protein